MTRWSIWIELTGYYCEHFKFVKTVIDKFKEYSAIAIKKSAIFNGKDIKASLLFIKAYYGNISSCITYLKTSGISLVKAIGIVNTVLFIACILNNTSNLDKVINTKLERALQKCMVHCNGNNFKNFRRRGNLSL